MADLYIDAAALERMRTNLLQIRELLERPGRELGQLDETCVGARELRRRMADFGDEWSYGIGQLSKFSGSAADALTQIEQAFRQVDGQLAQALQPRSGPG